MSTGPGPLRVSVCIPTLNAAEALEECLESIAMQDYPSDLVEIIVADGGSTDATRKVAERYGARVVENPLKTGEAGKAVAARAAQGDVCALIDSDNILPTADWLRRMTAPFSVAGVTASEPLRYECRAADPAITRYFALAGVNDPVCLFIGNYDRVSAVTGRWTDLPVQVDDRGDWLEVFLAGSPIPTIGANGFMIRRETLMNALVGDYLFDVDLVADMARRQGIVVAKVKVGIVHLYVDGLGAFARKQRRRVRDYREFTNSGLRSSGAGPPLFGLIRFVGSTLTVIPLIVQAWRGYGRKPDSAWLIHPVACWITLVVYAGEYVRVAFGRGRTEDRSHWSQTSGR